MHKTWLLGRNQTATVVCALSTHLQRYRHVVAGLNRPASGQTQQGLHLSRSSRDLFAWHMWVFGNTKRQHDRQQEIQRQQEKGKLTLTVDTVGTSTALLPKEQSREPWTGSSGTKGKGRP